MNDLNRQAYLDRKQEEREARRDRMRMTMGLIDFLGVVLGVFAIFVLVLLIVSLLAWLARDAKSTFSVIFSAFT